MVPAWWSGSASPYLSLSAVRQSSRHARMASGLHFLALHGRRHLPASVPACSLSFVISIDIHDPPSFKTRSPSEYVHLYKSSSLEELIPETHAHAERHRFERRPDSKFLLDQSIWYKAWLNLRVNFQTENSDTQRRAKQSSIWPWRRKENVLSFTTKQTEITI